MRRMPITHSSLLALAVLAAPVGCAPGDGPDDAGETLEDAGSGTSDGGTGGGSTNDGGSSGGGSGDGGTSDAGGSGSSGGGGSGGGGTVGSGACAAPIPLTCASGTATYDTATGGNGVDGYGCDGLFPNGYTGKELVFEFTNSTPAVASISATKTSAGATTFQLFQLETNPCDGPAECVASLDNTISENAPSAPLVFDVVAGEKTYLAYDVRLPSTLATETTTFTVTVACSASECGNGEIEPGEECDDGDTAAGDGCSTTCEVESNYACRETADGSSECHLIVCGDGIVDGNEACDDDGTAPLDGCSATCTVEDGYSCTNFDDAPSVCESGAGTCEEPLVLVSSVPLSFSTEGGPSDISEYGSECPYHSFDGPERVHSIDVPAGKGLRARVTASNFPSRIALTDGCGTQGECLSASTQGAIVLNRETSSKTVFVSVDGFLAADEGDYTLTAEVLDPAAFPAGDVCETALPLTPGTPRSTDTTGLLSAVSTWAGSCLAYGYPQPADGPDAFYSVSVPAGKTVQIVTSNFSPASVDSKILLFPSCDSPSETCLAAADVGSYGAGETLSYTNSGNSAATYYVAVDVRGDRGYSFSVTATIND